MDGMVLIERTEKEDSQTVFETFAAPRALSPEEIPALPAAAAGAGLFAAAYLISEKTGRLLAHFESEEALSAFVRTYPRPEALGALTLLFADGALQAGGPGQADPPLPAPAQAALRFDLAVPRLTVSAGRALYPAVREKAAALTARLFDPCQA